jgi:hypothetical protein
MANGDIPVLQPRTRAAIGALMGVTMFALLWDVSKPLLVAITTFGSIALFASEFGHGYIQIRKYTARAAALVTFILCAYGSLLALSPDILSEWQLLYSPIQIEMANISLTTSDKLRVVVDFHGTLAWIFVRAENRGDSNSTEDWRFFAKTTNGDIYPAELVQVMPTINLTNEASPQGEIYPYYPSDQIYQKAGKPMTKGQWVLGYAVFAFANIPVSTLNVPGTVFTLKCRDVLTQRISESTFKWTGKNDVWQFWPGMANPPYLPSPTAAATATR